MSNVEVFENDAYASINIVVDGSVSYRNFNIHFETLQDSAMAGIGISELTCNIVHVNVYTCTCIYMSVACPSQI